MKTFKQTKTDYTKKFSKPRNPVSESETSNLEELYRLKDYINKKNLSS